MFHRSGVRGVFPKLLLFESPVDVDLTEVLLVSFFLEMLLLRLEKISLCFGVMVLVPFLSVPYFARGIFLGGSWDLHQSVTEQMRFRLFPRISLLSRFAVEFGF